MAIPAIIPIAVAAASTGVSIYNTIRDSKEKREAKKALENYERQDLVNAYSNLGISTEAEEMAMDAAQRRFATEASQLSKLGARGAAMVGDLSQRFSEHERGIEASLDQKVNELQRLKAAEDSRIQMIKEERDRANIAGIGQLYNVARQNQATNISNILQSGAQLGSAVGAFSGSSNAFSSGANSIPSNNDYLSNPGNIIDSPATDWTPPGGGYDAVMDGGNFYQNT